jgi:cation:H+ antiporter
MEFASNPLWVNLCIFAASAALVWWAGSGLVRHAETIANLTGMTQGFVGLLLLATATSLPEVATTASAAASGAARLASNNLLGGVAMQTALLAVVDLVAVRGALTAFAPRAAVLLQGVLVILLLGAALLGGLGNLPQIGHVGAGSLVLPGLFILGLYACRAYDRRPAWIPRDAPAEERPPPDRDDEAGASLRRAGARFSALAGVILIAGWAIAMTGEAVAEQTGLGESFVGATLVAASTSLPELSTTVLAARRGAYGMAISNVFGSNSYDICLLSLADVIYAGGPIASAADRSAAFAACLGIVLTSVYLWGMLERRDTPVLRMGIDSWAVLLLYACGLIVMYRLRG